MNTAAAQDARLTTAYQLIANFILLSLCVACVCEPDDWNISVKFCLVQFRKEVKRSNGCKSRKIFTSSPQNPWRVAAVTPYSRRTIQACSFFPVSAGGHPSCCFHSPFSVLYQ